MNTTLPDKETLLLDPLLLSAARHSPRSFLDLGAETFDTLLSYASPSAGCTSSLRTSPHTGNSSSPSSSNKEHLEHLWSAMRNHSAKTKTKTMLNVTMQIISPRSSAQPTSQSPRKVSPKLTAAFLATLPKKTITSPRPPLRLTFGNAENNTENKPISAIYYTNPRMWSSNELSDWLTRIGYEQYCTIFTQKHKILGKDLFYIQDADLQDMQIHSLGHRKKILRHIQLLCEQHQNRKAATNVNNNNNATIALSSLTSSSDIETTPLAMMRNRKRLGLATSNSVLLYNQYRLMNAEGSCTTRTPDSQPEKLKKENILFCQCTFLGEEKCVMIKKKKQNYESKGKRSPSAASPWSFYKLLKKIKKEFEIPEALQLNLELVMDEDRDGCAKEVHSKDENALDAIKVRKYSCQDAYMSEDALSASCKFEITRKYSVPENNQSKKIESQTDSCCLSST